MAPPKKLHEYVQAIEDLKKVVLTNDIVHRNLAGEVSGFTRTDYVAVFSVSDVRYEGGQSLRFRLNDRLYGLS
ncbi:hypothetical protein ASD03_36770 [Ensifer sp. Root127]|nr:hypothetical protein ASD03_36770 [Ensifer sp. Root127]